MLQLNNFLDYTRFLKGPVATLTYIQTEACM